MHLHDLYVVWLCLEEPEHILPWP